MEDNFKPTKKDLLNLDALLLVIKNRKNTLVNRKMNLEHTLNRMSVSELNSREGRERRNKIKKILAEIELEIRKVNEERKYKNSVRLEAEQYIKHNKDSEPHLDRVIYDLTMLKGKYRDFTKDRTRIASLRIMATEFADELDNIIKSYK